MRVLTDSFGWPWVQIEDTKFWTNFLPVTKIQFEYLLCDEKVNRRFNKGWYDQRIISNPRVSTTAISGSNYHQLFMTDITAGEASYYAKWFQGRSPIVAGQLRCCRLLKESEWEHLVARCDAQPPLRWEDSPVVGEWSPRVEACLRGLERETRGVTQSDSSGWFSEQETAAESLSHQMLLRGGVFELVAQGNAFSVRGFPPSSFGGNHLGDRNGLPWVFDASERRQNFGFRLLVELDE